MKKLCSLLLVVLVSAMQLLAQRATETKNVVLITLDGFRWQELFQGADPELIKNSKFVSDFSAVSQFEGDNHTDMRSELLPFFWNTIARGGQLYGNRNLKSYANCSNPYWFSYPGYHEMLVGAVDRKVCSNAKIVNPNSTVLEYLHNQQSFTNRVAVYSTWDVFPYIIRETDSGISVNSGLEMVSSESISSTETELNSIQVRAGKRHDSVTFHLALEHLKQARPRFLYIALDETDDHAHGGRYDKYLLAAHRADQWLSDLWSWIQSQPDYKDQTTLFITADHGRGRNARKNWRNHGRLTFGSDEIWMAVLGPDTPPLGEMTNGQVYQKQVAKTLAAFLGKTYVNKFKIGETIHSMIQLAPLITNTDTKTIVVSNAKK